MSALDWLADQLAEHTAPGTPLHDYVNAQDGLFPHVDGPSDYRSEQEAVDVANERACTYRDAVRDGADPATTWNNVYGDHSAPPDQADDHDDQDGDYPADDYDAPVDDAEQNDNSDGEAA